MNEMRYAVMIERDARGARTVSTWESKWSTSRRRGALDIVRGSYREDG
jgi:hypothetical protein